ncbi:unnamed protein product, partial [Tetraodon nigroviridis]
YSTSTLDSRRNSRFGGFPFPLDRCDRRAPLPPCYSNQNLDDFLGPDGLPLPRSQCPSEYTAVGYYPNQRPRSLDSNSSGYKRLSLRMSVAMPSYPERAGSPRSPQPQTRLRGRTCAPTTGPAWWRVTTGAARRSCFSPAPVLERLLLLSSTTVVL